MSERVGGHFPVIAQLHSNLMSCYEYDRISV
jgi:hypothetical protein